MGQGISLDVLKTWAIDQREVEPGEEEGRSGFARIQSHRCPYVVKVPMVGEDDEWFLGALQPVSPVL